MGMGGPYTTSQELETFDPDADIYTQSAQSMDRAATGYAAGGQVNQYQTDAAEGFGSLMVPDPSQQRYQEQMTTGYMQPGFTTANQMIEGAAQPHHYEKKGGRNIAGAAGPTQAEIDAITAYGDVSGTGSISEGMQDFYNPYTQEVIDPAVAEIQKARDESLSAIGADAAAAGAYGGSRHGLVEAEAYEDANDAIAQMTADLYYQGFNTAGDLAARQQQAELAAAGGLSATGGQTAGRQLSAGTTQANLGGQQANRQLTAGQTAGNLATSQGQLQITGAQGASQAGLGQQDVALGAATGLGTVGAQTSDQAIRAAGGTAALGQQQFDTGQAIDQSLMTQALLDEQTMQGIIDAGAAGFEGYVTEPDQSVDIALAATGNSPLTGNVTGESTYEPGLYDYASLGMQTTGAKK